MSISHTDTQSPSESHKWRVALGLSLLFILPSVGYVQYGYANSSVLETLSFISASVASLMFAIAFSLGSISYFTGWPNLRHGYQKQIGVTAFWWSAVYTLTLPMLYPELYWYGLPSYVFSADVLLGLSAMTIFAAMVLINSRWVAPYFTKKTIFFILGLGYVGYALLVIRAVFLEFDLWVLWMQTASGLPPGRLLLSIVALSVLLLRVLVAVHKHYRKR